LDYSIAFTSESYDATTRVLTPAVPTGGAICTRVVNAVVGYDVTTGAFPTCGREEAVGQ